MSTVLPNRWWGVLQMLFLGALLGYLIGPLFVGEFNAEEGSGMLVGMFVGLLFGLFVVAVWSRQDARLAAVRSLHPWGIVVQAWADKRLVARLRSLNPEAGAPKVGRQVTVAFDRPGISFYTGTSEPILMLTLPWAGLTGFGIEQVPKTPNIGFILRLNLGEPLQFSLDRGPWLLAQGGIASEARLRDVALDVQALRSDILGTPVAPAPALADGLIPGPTAAAAKRIAFIPIWALTVVLLPALVTCVTILVTDGPDDGAFVTAVVGGLTLYTIVTIIWSATRAGRERAAGYTTLNGTQLDLEQRHPKTGRVIRPAGARALSMLQYVDELRR